jgi:hypothetical protein
MINPLAVYTKYIYCFVFIILVGALLSPVRAATEKYNSGWQLTMDNNIFQRYMKDRDYTAGIAFTASGSRAQSGWLNVDPVRAWIFDFLPITNAADKDIQRHSVQYGLLLFTPENITATQPVIDDRPFASLLYISNTELVVTPAANVAYRSSLTLGLLGLDAAGDIQRILHEITGSEQANGWNNQISAGGEPTAMLTLSAQHKLYAANGHQLTSHLEANAGYSTDVNAGLNWRWGRLNTPWWSFDPSHNDYIASAAASERGIAGSLPEYYMFAAIDIKYRFYSVLLQGQFRDSVYTLESDQIENVIVGLATGVAREFGDNLRVSFSVRGTTPEIKGPNARDLWWASLAINRAF